MDKNTLYITQIILLMFLLAACTPEERFQNQLDDAMAEDITYLKYSDNGFSIKYPDWPAQEDKDDNIEVSVTKGYCSVIINSEGMTPEQWYVAILDGAEKTEDNKIMIADEKESHVKYSSRYQNFTMMMDTRVYGCNGTSNAVSIICIKEADERSQDMHTEIFDSAECTETIQEDGMQKTGQWHEEEKQEITYIKFKDEDYLMEHPDWEKAKDDEKDRILGVSIGTCSVFVNKYNALPKDLAGWIKNTITEDEKNELLLFSDKDDEYQINYKFPYEEYVLTAKTKLFYCNYMTYMTITACIDNMTTEEFEEMNNKVLDSAICTKEYQVPTPEITKKKKKEIEEKEPETVEEIEDIVKTDAGEEFGIDEEMVVFFINNNEFFRKIMKDFPKSNLVFEDNDNDRKLKLKVRVEDDGMISSVEDGQHNDPDVTLILPLRDALNIFNNADNINPLTLIGFAINVRTEPSNIKDEVIQKVLRGEYN